MSDAKLKKLHPKWPGVLPLLGSAILIVLVMVAEVVIALFCLLTAYVFLAQNQEAHVWEQQHPELILALLIIVTLAVLIGTARFNYHGWGRLRADAWNQQGKRFARHHHYQEAIPYYRVALEQIPDLSAARYNLEIALIRLRRYEEALSVCDQALALRYGDATSWLNKGVALGYLTRYGEALSAYNIALTLNPTEALVWHNIASILTNDLNRYEEALVVCNKAIERGVATAGIWSTMGESLKALGREEEAQAAFEQTLMSPQYEYLANEYLSYAAKGYVLVNMKRYDEALDAYDMAIALRPDVSYLRRGRAKVLHELGRHAEALAACEQAISLNPNDAVSWYDKGVYLTRLKRYGEALAAYDQALSLNPNDASAWNGKGVTRERMKQFDEAVANFDHALQLDPQDTLAWNNKASVLYDGLKRYDDALTVCNEALAHGVSTAGIWSTKGQALQSLGREAEAQAAFEQVLTFPANDFLSWASHGAALSSLGQYEEGIAAFDQALTYNPDHAGVLREKAKTLRALGREAEALEVERRAGELER